MNAYFAAYFHIPKWLLLWHELNKIPSRYRFKPKRMEIILYVDMHVCFANDTKKLLRMIQIKKQRISQYDRNSMISHWNLWKKASNTDIEYKKRMWLDFLLIGH